MLKRLLLTGVFILLACNANNITGDNSNNNGNGDDYPRKNIILVDVPDMPNPLFYTIAETYDSLQFGIDSVIIYDFENDRNLEKIVLNKAITLNSIKEGVNIGLLPYDESLYYLFYFTGVDSVINTWITSRNGGKANLAQGYFADKDGTYRDYIFLSQGVNADSQIIVDTKLYKADIAFQVKDTFYIGADTFLLPVKGDSVMIYLLPNGGQGVGWPELTYGSP